MRPHRFVTALVAAAALGPPPAALAEPPAVHVVFERFVLENGLTVILHEDHRTPQVAVNLWFSVGSKDERAGRTGFAHLFEHLMFMGTRRVPNGEFDAIMEAEGGQNNASTSEDRTNYFETGPAHLLETFLWLEADRLSSLADDMSTEKVDLQRDVVKNERRQSYENRPYGQVELVLPERMFAEGHPYHHPVIGSHKDLTAASAEDVKDFFRAFYVPANASLVVAGDFQAKDARKLVEKYFAWMPKAPVPAHADPVPGTLAKDERVLLEDAIELPRLVLAWHSPRALGDGDAQADLLAAVLGGGKSSRLYQALVYKKKIAQAVEVEQRGMRGSGLFVATVTAQPGHDAAELERETAAEIAALAAAPPSDAELARARALVETQTLRAVERLPMMADVLNLFEFYFHDPARIEKELLGRYERVTAADLDKLGKSIFSAHHLAILVSPRARPAAAAGTGAKGGAK